MMFGRLAIAAVLLAVLSGCDLVGPDSIERGRENYNDTIQSTAKAQVFQNLIRAYEHEPTLFMDVTEVDASLTLQGSATYGISNLGAHPHPSPAVGALGGGATYTENPTVRYFPLAGPALIQQILVPISPQTLAYLYSQQSWLTVLEFSVSRFTPGYEDSQIALDALGELDNYEALEVWAKASPSALSPDGKSPAPADTLVLSLRPDHPFVHRIAGKTVAQDVLVAKEHIWRFWLRLLRLYEDSNGTVVAGARSGSCASTNGRIDDAALVKIDKSLDGFATETELNNAVACLSRQIELRTVGATEAVAPQQGAASGDASPAKHGSHAEAPTQTPAPRDVVSPVLHTNSGLAALQLGAGPGGGIAFIQPDQLGDYAVDCGYYYMQTKPFSAGQIAKVAPEEGAIYRLIDAKLAAKDKARSSACDLTSVDGDHFLDIRDYQAARSEKLFALRRSFILVLVGEPPADAYASYTDPHGKSFYIRGDDTISQQNFLILSQLLTMQAVQSPAGQLTPTVSVGGH